MSDLLNNQTQNKKEEIKELEEEIVPNVKNIKLKKHLYYQVRDYYIVIPGMGSITLKKKMTIKEDKIRLRNEGEDKIRRDLLRACVVGEGIDIGQLTLFDVNYLLFCLRRISLLNNTYKVRCVCPNCDSEFVDELDLTKLQIKYVDPNNLPNFDVTLPVSGLKIKLKYPSLNSVIIFRDKITEFLNVNTDTDISELLYVLGDMLYIDTVNGKPTVYEELEDIIENLDILDSREIKKAIKQLDNRYGIDDDILCKCPKCKNELHHGLPITSELFTPSL